MDEMSSAQTTPVAAESLALPAGDSTTQREAEAVILAALGKQIGVALVPTRIILADKARVEVDGVSNDPPVLCEAWAHQGAPKSAQRNKVLTDALKLAFVGSLREARPRLILAFSDAAAAQPFRGQSWYAHALRELSIEIVVVEIPDDLRERIRQAQVRQYR